TTPNTPSSPKRSGSAADAINLDIRCLAAPPAVNGRHPGKTYPHAGAAIDGHPSAHGDVPPVEVQGEDALRPTYPASHVISAPGEVQRLGNRREAFLRCLRAPDPPSAEGRADE